jgi:hypothetical protein
MPLVLQVASRTKYSRESPPELYVTVYEKSHRYWHHMFITHYWHNLEWKVCNESTRNRIMTRVEIDASCQNVKVLTQCCNHQKRIDGERCNEKVLAMVDFCDVYTTGYHMFSENVAWPAQKLRNGWYNPKMDYIANMAKRRVLHCNSESKMYYIAITYKMI